MRLPALFIRLCQPALDYFYWLGASQELSDRGITLRFLESQSEAAHRGPSLNRHSHPASLCFRRPLSAFLILILGISYAGDFGRAICPRVVQAQRKPAFFTAATVSLV